MSTNDFTVKLPPFFEHPERFDEIINDGLTTIANDFITQASEATPTAFHSAMQGGWKESTREISSTQAMVSVVNVAPYAHYVINGTGPAARNPGGFLVQWVDYKLSPAQQYKIARYAGMSEEAARGALGRSNVKFKVSSLAVAVAFIIGRARMKRGSKGNDFVTPIIEENIDRYAQDLADLILRRML